MLVVLASAGVAYAKPSDVQYGPRDGGNRGGGGGGGGNGGHHGGSHHGGSHHGGSHHGGSHHGGGFGAFAQSNEQNCVVQGSLGINCLQAAANQINTGDQAAGASTGDV